MSQTHLRRSGFSFIELMVVVAVVALLLCVAVPMILKYREDDRKARCKNNLKAIGVALHNYHDTCSRFPLGWIGVDSKSAGADVRGATGFSWGIGLLPYLKHAPLFGQFDFQTKLSQPKNAKLLATSIPAYRCPSDPFTRETWETEDITGSGRLKLATTNYVGSFGTDDLTKCEKMEPGKTCRSNGLFSHNMAIRIADFTDGTANTLAFGERISSGQNDYLSTWSGVVADKHPFSRFLGNSHTAFTGKERHPSDYYSPHYGGGQFLLTDGTVRFLALGLELEVFQALTTRAGGEQILTRK